MTYDFFFTHAWVINPITGGAFIDQRTGCLPDERRAANEFLDGCTSTDPIHIWSNVPFTYFGPQANNTPPDPIENCSSGNVTIDYCQITNDQSCNVIFPPADQREAWFEMIDTTADYQYRQYLWQAFLSEIIALDTLGTDTTIVSFIDSLDESISKWYKITWYLDHYNFYIADSLLSVVTRTNAHDIALYDYFTVLHGITFNDGGLFPFNEDRTAQLNNLLESSESVKRRIECLYEIVGINKYVYEPEQIPEIRLSFVENLPVKSNKFAESYIVIYPNPSNGIFNLQLMKAPAEIERINIEIFNSIGVKVLQLEQYVDSNSNEVKIDLSGHQPGLYHGRAIVGDKIYFGRLTNLGR